LKGFSNISPALKFWLATEVVQLFYYYDYYSAKGMARAGRVKKMPMRAINWSIRVAVKNMFKVF
jgi:hypothetical protein